MFENLSEKIVGSIKKLKGNHKITESNIEATLKEIRLSLLEADVNFTVVKSFIQRVKAKALGEAVLKNLNPGQQFVKIVHDELITVLGGDTVSLNLKNQPSIIFLVGLQGVGKTTTAAKLTIFLRQKEKKKVGLVSVDIHRPAAIEQLATLAKQNQIPFFQSNAQQNPEDILTSAYSWAKDQWLDVIIVDTAGRLQIDEELMEELKKIKQVCQPQEILFVADAMLGQHSVNVAEGFHKQIGLTGLILTKVDGDARGGAALSVRESLGIPIKFLGLGEKVGQLEIFHPDRLASRILDMGDILSLVEKAQDVIDKDEALASTEKMMKNKFTVEDFLKQLQYMKKLGGLEGIMKFIPGMGQITKEMKNLAPADKEIKKIEAIIHSMTLEERQNYKILNGSRRLRIARGSGTKVSDVNKFIHQFIESQKMMSQMMKMGLGRQKNNRFN